MTAVSLLSFYLIYPLAGMLLAGLAVILAKKKKLLANKKLIAYFILAILALALFGLAGWLDYKFMPYGYLILALVYLLLGYYNILIMGRVMKREDTKFRVYLLTAIFISVIGMLLFAMVFNIVNELKYGLWAATSMILFIFPLVFAQTFRLFLGIPAEILKKWRYDSRVQYADHEGGESDNVIVLQLELFRTETDPEPEPLKLKAKASLDAPFGQWFFRLVSDYNVKSPSMPIDLGADRDTRWIFYVKRSIFLPRHYLDHERTIKGNKLTEKHPIIAKRVMQDSAQE
jgi:hypothetical protein